MIKNSIEINKKRIKKVDIVVGIPSLNEADNIFFVVEQVDKGLSKYFPNHRAVIINVDNYSEDGTKEVFLKTKTKFPKIYISTPPGLLGKGRNFYNLFSKIKELEAKAVVVVDADLKSIKPEWMDHLLSPILDGYDYITPYYSRSEYDGSITNHICYPLIYGLFGKNIRQPIGGDFSFSSKLSDYWLKKKWHKTTYEYGIDIFMTINAILGDFKIGQAGLGEKIHKPSAPKLGPMFSQVVSTLAKNIRDSRKRWMSTIKEDDIPYLGQLKNMPTESPQTMSIDYKGMKMASVFNFKANENILQGALSDRVFNRLKNMYNKEIVDIDVSLWHKIIYDIIYAYGEKNSKYGLIEALKPLYFGRFITFYKKTLEMPFSDCEDEIGFQAETFWRHRDYLIDKYREK